MELQPGLNLLSSPGHPKGVVKDLRKGNICDFNSPYLAQKGLVPVHINANGSGQHLEIDSLSRPVQDSQHDSLEISRPILTRLWLTVPVIETIIQSRESTITLSLQ